MALRAFADSGAKFVSVHSKENSLEIILAKLLLLSDSDLSAICPISESTGSIGFPEAFDGR